MGHQRPTMKDVARHADVSVKTVSRVVNNERWVSEQVVTRVEAAIEALGYRPDVRARAMRNSDLVGRTIGVVHADISNPFFTAVHSGLELVAERAGCLILTAGSRDSVARQEAILRTFTDRRVDGLVVVPAADSASCEAEALRDELERGTPVVFVDRRHDHRSDFVGSDNYGGARAATEHLLAHGHRDIAFLGDLASLYSAQRRSAGFLDDPVVRPGLATEDEADRIATALLERDGRPTAIFAAKNHLTIGVVKALHRLGLQHEVAVIGFDEVPMATVVEPAISVVPQDAQALGRIAGNLLLERMDGLRSEPAERIVPVAVVARGSGELAGPFG